MIGKILIWTVILAALAGLFLFAEMVYLSAVLSWEDKKTEGKNYYGAPPAERAEFRRALKRHARRLSPILALLGRFSNFSFAKTSFHHRGIAAPRGTTSPASFARADAWPAGPQDVFVATQMKCGTTWMLHLVYQVLLRGAGDLVETGATLHAVSPWIEGRKTVSMEDAPLIGTERPSRVIKTHLPVSHIPWSPEARYIYVVRHPVSCFVSCADFIRSNAGRFAPPSATIEEWFRSDELMWWGTWTAHVEGWWKASEENSNTLFVTFEEMKRDLPGVVRRLTDFLGIGPLGEAELARVVDKCSFRYMQEHDDNFEMHPPHILSAHADLFVSGRSDRHADAPEPVRRQIAAWCADRMTGGRFPLAKFYPDVTS